MKHNGALFGAPFFIGILYPDAGCATHFPKLGSPPFSQKEFPMPALTEQQEAKRAQLRRSALIWGGVVGLVVAGLAWWMLDSQTTVVRAAITVVLGGAVALVMFRKSMASGEEAARCAKCGAQFSLVKTDQSETLAHSEPREKREEQADGPTRITTWIEETYDVDDTYTCSNCGTVTHKKYQITRRKDEKTREQRTASKTASKTTHKKAAKPGKSTPKSTMKAEKQHKSRKK